MGAVWLKRQGRSVEFASEVIINFQGQAKKMKVPWEGKALAVQPRIRLWRSFDERMHTYLGYCLFLRGHIAGQAGVFTVGIGQTAQAKHQFRAGDEIGGTSEPVQDPRREPVEYYKTSGLKLIARATASAEPTGPPWRLTPPDLEIYRERGHRRLHAKTYEVKCAGCMWGCRMPVEVIPDNWKPDQKQYRFETFCYGPKSCRFYKAGAARKVPGRGGIYWVEEDWVDAEATAHRSDDE
jgi:hypothetical protein